MGVCIFGICNVWVCVCLGFVMCGCLYLRLCVCVVFLMREFVCVWVSLFVGFLYVCVL